MVKCLPPTDPNNNWTYCPSQSAAIIFTILFALTSGLHIFQARKYRTNFCWTIIMGSLWEFLSFVFRNASIVNPTSQGAYDPSFLLFLLAPFSFIIQIGGGLLTISKNYNTLNTGLHIYTAGVALQEFFILVFLFLVEASVEKQAGAGKLLLILYVSLGLITFRILFRIIEFSAGAGTALTAEFSKHEVYQYVFDALPMFLALATMNGLHPGMVLAGEDSKFAKVRDGESGGEGLVLGDVSA
ncbi:hypothetical protein LSUE1_G003490 [Lachnellula suecica]|uniref:Uncharacterized protein n=1 Tax=Lachnellula suecica TaxID=602035 RepID=A0A8T9C547_9HELO|nr:hypothetical protein LSUE1_G003490 [Lachnellula suecica]